MPTNELNSYWQNIEHERAELLVKNRELRAITQKMADRLQRAIDSYAGSYVGDEKLIAEARAALQKAR